MNAIEISGLKKQFPKSGFLLDLPRLAVQEGDSQKGCFLSGQIAAMVKKEQPAAEIIKEVMEEAEPILLRAPQWVK